MSTHNICFFLGRNKQNYPLIIIKYPPYLFHWLYPVDTIISACIFLSHYSSCASSTTLLSVLAFRWCPTPSPQQYATGTLGTAASPTSHVWVCGSTTSTAIIRTRVRHAPTPSRRVWYQPDVWSSEPTTATTPTTKLICVTVCQWHQYTMNDTIQRSMVQTKQIFWLVEQIWCIWWY